MARIGFVDKGGECVQFKDLVATYDPHRWGRIPLPQLMYQAREKEKYPVPIHYTASQLPRPIKALILCQRHDWYEVPEASFYAAIGRAWHEMLAAEARKIGVNALAEEQLWRGVDVNGKRFTVGATPDLMTEWKGMIDDYDHKSTSVWKGVDVSQNGWDEAWPDVVAQLNVGRWVCKEHLVKPAHLLVNALWRDWRPGERAKYPEHYPESAQSILKVPDWTLQETHDWIVQRIQDIEDAKRLADDDLPACTPKERWVREEQWAVKKKANKNATKCHDSLEAAEADLKDRQATAKKGDEWIIEHRPGVSTRCCDYCPAVLWCKQGQAHLNGRSVTKYVSGTTDHSADQAA